MKILLVPGFWLDASSWDRVVPGLEAAGHEPVALTLPGLESRDADRSGITLQDHVDALVAAVDAAGEPVVLVGHSGGGSVVSGAIDARPDRVVRAVYVDSKPAGEGDVVNAELPVADGEIPLPDLDAAFDEGDLADLVGEVRERFVADALPHPVGPAVDPAHPTDDRRLDVPSTIIATALTSDTIRAAMQPDHPWHGYVTELTRLRDLEIVDLPTGHWPQLTKPDELAALIVAAVDRT